MVQAAENPSRHDTVANRDPMVAASCRETIAYRIGDAWPQTGVRTPTIVVVIRNNDARALALRAVHAAILSKRYS